VSIAPVCSFSRSATQRARVEVGGNVDALAKPVAVVRGQSEVSNAALARQTHRQHAQPVVSNGQGGQARTRHAGGRPGLPCVSTDKRKLECAKGRDCGIRVSEVGREKNV
jgi:hypothetical protein